MILSMTLCFFGTIAYIVVVGYFTECQRRKDEERREGGAK